MKKGLSFLSVFIILFPIGILGCASIQGKNDALSLYQQGQKALEDRKYVEAYELFKQSLKNYQFFNVDKGIAANHIMMGDIHLTLGTYQEALRSYENALRIYRELETQEGIASTVSRMGRLYKLLDRYDKALDLYEEALNTYRKTNNPEGIATNLTSIGLLYQRIGNYDKALNYHNETLMIYKTLNVPKFIATSLNNIGAVYHSAENYKDALIYYNESLRIRKELNLTDDIYGTLINTGSVYFSQKNYRDAAKYFDEAERTKGVEFGTTLGWVDISLALKKYDDTLFLLKDKTPRWNATGSYQIQFYTLHGGALKGKKMLKESSSDFLKAISISEDMRQRIKGEKSGFLGAGSAGGRIRAYRGLVSTLAERALNGEQFDNLFIPYGKDLASSAFYFAEATKARTLLETMAESARKYNKTEFPVELRKKEEDILHQLSAIENIWEDTYKKGEEGFKELVKRKEELKKELDSFIALLRKEYPLYASLNYPRPVSAEDLPLKDNEVLIEYAIGDDACYVFVVRKGGVKNLIKIPIGREALEEKIKTLVEPFNTGSPSEFSVSMAKGLYDILLADVFKDIKETEKVIIIPDGILGLLPFEVLVVKEGEGYKDSFYVGDKWAISYSQSATALTLTRMLKPSKANKPLFAIGNPVYSKEDPRYIAYKQGKQQQIPPLAQNLNNYAYRGVTIVPKMDKTDKDSREWEEVIFAPLPETEDEVKAISKLFDTKPEAPDVLLNVMANETNLRKVSLEDYRYLHFATHADLPGKVQGMKEPFIILGQVENKEKDDGFLTLSEVLDLGLDADMVVLSACVTGRGKMMEGEGVANFARAFQHAGARSVVVSLWEVASKETVEYMEIFYRHLKEGKSRAEALTLARNTIKSRYPNPFYWAPFILHGEG